MFADIQKYTLIERISGNVEHAFSCPKGGFPTIRHNEIRNLTASLLTDEVQVEPTLQPLSAPFWRVF